MSPSETNEQLQLSAERKLRMHEAREAIIDRLARDLPTNIDLERFLNVVVSEIGRMLDADRCDLLQLDDKQELASATNGAGTNPCQKATGRRSRSMRKSSAETFDVTKPIRINDTPAGQRRDTQVFCKGARDAFAA